ncbi:MAG: phosphotransferase [Oscillospiraceae bacterium]|nr:phosphotransferase [Oscillospiraceae bacterium]
MVCFDEVLAVRPTKIIYRDGESVLKVFNVNFSKSDILNEALNQARVEETGLNIPRVLEVLKTDGMWAVRSAFIPGRTLQELMDEQPERLEEYLGIFVDLQLEVHSKRAPLLNRLTDKLDFKIAESSFDATTRYELHNWLMALPAGKSVCHGDFNPSNIIIEPDGTPFLLDWAHATQGSPAGDAAGSFLLFELAGKRETGQRYLELFCEKSGLSYEEVRKWLPLVAAAQSVNNIPEQRELLERWVNADYSADGTR